MHHTQVLHFKLESKISLCISNQPIHTYLLEQGPLATEEAASLADRQFWWRGDKMELRRRSMFLTIE